MRPRSARSASIWATTPAVRRPAWWPRKSRMLSRGGEDSSSVARSSSSSRVAKALSGPHCGTRRCATTRQDGRGGNPRARRLGTHTFRTPVRWQAGRDAATAPPAGRRSGFGGGTATAGRSGWRSQRPAGRDRSAAAGRAGRSSSRPRTGHRPRANLRSRGPAPRPRLSVRRDGRHEPSTQQSPATPRPTSPPLSRMDPGAAFRQPRPDTTTRAGTGPARAAGPDNRGSGPVAAGPDVSPQVAVQAGARVPGLPVAWKPNSVAWPAVNRPL